MVASMQKFELLEDMNIAAEVDFEVKKLDVSFYRFLLASMIISVRLQRSLGRTKMMTPMTDDLVQDDVDATLSLDDRHN